CGGLSLRIDTKRGRGVGCKQVKFERNVVCVFRIEVKERMVPFSCTARGVKVSGWRVGEGERVLSTHGWLDNANSWKPVAQQVSGLDWASFDFPGHGRSGHIAPGETYHFVD